MARTLALTRAEGIITRTLDADDLLIDGALARDIEVLTSRTTAGWCLSPTIDLFSDGTQQPSEPIADPGPLPVGHFLAAADRLDVTSIAGSAMCAHTDLIRAVGGWPAIPANDDVGLLLAVDAVSEGWMIAKPSLMYRRWPGSTTDALDAVSVTAADRREAAILGRARALRRTGWSWTPDGQPAGRRSG